MRLHIFLFMLVSLVTYPAISHAHDGQQPRIEVTGEGSATLVPDMAVLTLTVTREGKTARAALDANNQAMAEVMAMMREEGIEERDLQTTGFSINPQIVYPENNGRSEGPKIAGYSVSNTLSVRIRDISRLGVILDRSVSMGVNEGGQISFTNSDPSSAISEARSAAVEDALKRATTLATAAGGDTGDILKITEQSQIPPMPMPHSDMAMRMAESVPVAPGENTYKVFVTITVELRQ